MGEISPNEKYLTMLGRVNQKVIQGELTLEEFERIKEEYVAPGWRVNDLITSALTVGQVRWVGEKLVFDIFGRLNLNLDPKTDAALRRVVVESGEKPENVVARILKQHLGTDG